MQGWASSVVAGLADSQWGHQEASILAWHEEQVYTWVMECMNEEGYGVHERGRLWSAGSGEEG
jgi:hypothetical protein